MVERTRIEQIAGQTSEGAEQTDRECLEAVLDEVGHGYLGVTGADGSPLVFPLNFVRSGDLVYFHGAPAGEKMSAIERDSRVGFTVVDAGSLIPSYLRNPRSACPATQYYRSVMIRGRARVVEDPREKARALQAMMEKLQPEGGHEVIEAEAELYVKALRVTAVVAIEIESMSGKFKFGQNLTDKVRENVTRGLIERGDVEDERTVQRMLAWANHSIDVHVE